MVSVTLFNGISTFTGYFYAKAMDVKKNIQFQYFLRKKYILQTLTYFDKINQRKIHLIKNIISRPAKAKDKSEATV